MSESRKSKPLRLFIVALFIAISLLSMGFAVYLMLNAANGFVFALAVAYGLLSLISLVFNAVTSYSYYKSYFYDEYLEKLTRSLKPIRSYPTVAVLIPTYSETPEFIERNLKTLKGIDYDPKKIAFYLADDSQDPEMVSGKRALCERYGVNYIHRNDRKDFKVGALNNALLHSKEEFVAIFDADERIVDPRFVKDLLPYFQDESVAFVQTEKRFEKASLFSDSVDLFDTLFFRFIQPARALNGTAIFAGSCGLIRRSAIDAIGGFPAYVTEDTFFSFESDMHNFKSVYVPKAYALGKPLTFSELCSQQWRYNYGDTQFLFYFLKRIRSDKGHRATLFSKVDYLAHGFGLNYLSAILILFTVVSLLTVFSAAPFAYSSAAQFVTASSTAINLEILGVISFLLSLIVPVALTKAYFDSYLEGLMLFFLNFALSFVRLKGAVSAMLAANPFKGWFKGSIGRSGTGRILASLRNSSIELVFSAILLFGSLTAMLLSNISGALWMLWYGALYTSTFVFFLRYG
ncbi:MAG: glycosyltransferase [Candidatus Micrarchaeota archaeon]|nr:glycosyltransferase [Candidatus Micrarchaeota archaeon]